MGDMSREVNRIVDLLIVQLQKRGCDMVQLETDLRQMHDVCLHHRVVGIGERCSCCKFCGSVKFCDCMVMSSGSDSSDAPSPLHPMECSMMQ